MNFSTYIPSMEYTEQNFFKPISSVFQEPTIPLSLQHKYKALCQRLQEFEFVIIGFSGGVDSVFLSAIARMILGKEKVLACTAISPSLPERELLEANSLTKLLDLNWQPFDSTEFANDLYLQNTAERCYHCKSDLYKHLKRFAQNYPQATLLYGGNLDDQSDYRPGQKAALENGAIAPLAEAKLSKAEIRQLSKLWGLPTHDKPAMPCLSSRIPYGSKVTREKLSAIEQGENWLREKGFKNYRLRHEGDIARIEIPLNQMALWNNIQSIQEFVILLKSLGFKKILLDLEGFRSGNLNEALGLTAL